MPFRPTIKTSIQLNGSTYHFSEHPAAKGMPYGQTGRRATVYQVKNGADLNALKVFTKAFRSHQIEGGAKRIADFATLSGLQVCARLVLTRQNHRHLIEEQPDLEYAVLMPWVQGLTWQEIMLARQPFTQAQSLDTARHFVNILAAMEERGLAHCDLSGPNILLEDTLVNLVDVEDMYGSGLEKPEKLPGGSAGYAHKTAAQGLWSAEADRFAGAVLIAEMLGWCDERVRRVGVGEQYFDAGELQIGCDRYNLLLSVLTQRYGHALAESFTSAWYSKRLEDCPRFVDWQGWLAGSGDMFTVSEPQVHPTISQKQVVLNDAGRYLFDSIKEKIKNKDFSEAEQLVDALKVLAPGFDEPANLLEQARQQASQEQAQKEKIANLEHELAQKRGLAESIQQQIEKLQVELKGAQKACIEIEEKLTLAKGESLPSYNQASIDVSPKSQKPKQEPVNSILSVSKREKAELCLEFQAIAHTKMMGMVHVPIESALFLPGGERFVTLAEGKKCAVWRFRKGNATIISEIGLFGEPRYVALHPNTKKLAIGYKYGWIDVFNVEQGFTSVDHYGVSDDDDVNALAFDAAGKVLAAASGNTISFCSVDDLTDMEMDLSCEKDVECLGYTPDGKYFIYAEYDGTLYLLTASNLSPVAKTKVGPLPSLVIAPNSRYFCCGDENGKVSVFSIPDMRLVNSFSHENSSTIQSMALSPAGDLLATATSMGQIHLWRLGDGKLLSSSHEHNDDVFGLDFHPSGNYLLSASYDGRAIVWKIK
jgi:WD40 repeat protein